MKLPSKAKLRQTLNLLELGFVQPVRVNLDRLVRYPTVVYKAAVRYERQSHEIWINVGVGTYISYQENINN